jgi:hypothetical protein
MRFRDWFGQLDRGHRVLVCVWGSLFLCMLISQMLFSSFFLNLFQLQENSIYVYFSIFNIFLYTIMILLTTQWLVMGPGSVLARWLICLVTFSYGFVFSSFITSNDLNLIFGIIYSTIIIIWTILRGCKLLELKSLAEVERDRQQPWQFSIKYLLVIVTLLPLLIYFPSFISYYQWRSFFGLAQFLIVTNLLVLGTHSRWWNIMLVPWAMTSWCWLNYQTWPEMARNFGIGTNVNQAFQRVNSHPTPPPQLTWLEELQKHLAETYEPFLNPSGITLFMCSLTAIYLGLLWCQRYAGYRLVLNRSQPPATVVPVAESVNPLVE